MTISARTLHNRPLRILGGTNHGEQLAREILGNFVVGFEVPNLSNAGRRNAQATPKIHEAPGQFAQTCPRNGTTSPRPQVSRSAQ